jgi:hypothetical protein
MRMILEKENYLKGMVRDIVAVNPLVSIRGMQDLIKNNTGHTISKNYASQLINKVRRQAVIESDRKKMNERLAEMRERHRVRMQYLERLIYWKPKYYREYGMNEPSPKEKMMAIKLQAHLDTSLFKAELTAGMFEDKRNAIAEMLKQGILPTELNEQIVGVFRSWKMGPTRTEQREIRKIE